MDRDDIITIILTVAWASIPVGIVIMCIIEVILQGGNCG